MHCCHVLARGSVEVTLIDRRNFHLFQPLLYQVATGGLSPGDIAAPLRTVLKDARNVRVLLGDVSEIDIAERSVSLHHDDHDEQVPYDTLVVAAGARHSYFGKDQWEAFAPGLKTVEDASEMRARVLDAFEAAELEQDPARRAEWLTFVIVGGGPTGVELAGALAELARDTMRGEFRRINPAQARIVLIEGLPEILSMYVPKLARYARQVLGRLGVEVLTSSKVVQVDEGGLEIEHTGGRERLAARTVLWAAGVAGSPLGGVLCAHADAELDRAGRVVVEPDCTLRQHPEIFVIGDLAHWAHTRDGRPLPGLAPVAMQMGKYVGRCILHRIEGRPTVPFRYRDKGSMAVVGRNHAVAHVGFGLGWDLGGFLAWLAWLYVHIVFLVGYENRLLVLIQWANHYLTRNRGARLITHGSSGVAAIKRATSGRSA